METEENKNWERKKEKMCEDEKKKEGGLKAMKKLKCFIPGCVAMIAGLLLCTPVMAGGYSASSELKVNIIGIRPWPEEPETVEEMYLFTEQELPQATPSNVSKSDAVRANISHADDDLSDIRLSSASPSNAEYTEPWNDENVEEKEKENKNFNRDDKMDNLLGKKPDEGWEERLSTPSDGKRANISDANTT